MNEVTELRIFVLQLENRILALEMALAKERGQKASAGRASAKKRWGKHEVVTALQISTPKKSRPRKEKIDAVVTALPTALPKRNLLFELVEHWRAEYCRVYNTEAMKGSKKDFSHAKFILEKCSGDLDRASALVTHFMSRRESWYVTKGHTLQTLVGDIDRLWAELGNGQIITSYTAKKAQVMEHNRDVMSKPLEGPSLLDIADNLEKAFLEAKHGRTKTVSGHGQEALRSASIGPADSD